MGEFQAYERTLDAPPPNRKSKKWLWTLLIIFAVIIALTLSVKSCMDSITITGLTGADTVAAPVYPSTPYVGVLYVEGTIAPSNTNSLGTATGYQHWYAMDSVDGMMYDDNNQGILLFVDSPGGTIYESDELYLKLEEYQEVTGRPVYAYMGSMAASGGYYVCAGADKILANRNTWTGSIGVTVGSFFDVSGLLERYGVDTVTITSGEHKAMGSYLEPMGAEEQAIWQALIDEAYEQFVGIVAEGRGMDLALVKELADGRIYSAYQAEEAGLIDGVCSYEDAISDMMDSYDLWDCSFQDFYYVDNSFWGQLRGLAGGVAAAREPGDVAALLSVIAESNQYPVSYLCEYMR